MMSLDNNSEAKKKIVKTMLSRGAMLDSSSIMMLERIEDSRLLEIASTLNDLPVKDFDIIIEDPKLFFSFFERISQEEFYNIKSELLKEHGLSLYDNYLDLMSSRILGMNNSQSNRLSNDNVDTIVDKNNMNNNNNNNNNLGKSSQEHGNGQLIREYDDVETIIGGKTIPDDIEVIFHYEDLVKKRVVKDFVQFFSSRLDQIGRMLKNRIELNDALPIRRISNVSNRDKLSVIGMVSDIRETKNNNTIIMLEDKTGILTCIASNKRREVHEKVRDLTLDEVIGVRGVKAQDSIYIEDIIWPDISPEGIMNKSNSDVGAIVISDLQYGHKMFLDIEFEEFIKWMSGEIKDEHSYLLSNVKYLFIVGDLVEGIGIFPGQDNELLKDDIRSQFNGLAEYLKRIPSHIRIIAIAGNHDPVRLSEPQPILPKDYAKSLYDLDNFYCFSNPSILRVGKEQDYRGMEFLLYHGMSYDYYVNHVESIRLAGGYDAPIDLMKYLLKRRHLAPSHTSSLYIPDTRKDYLVIESIPDIFLSGHLHRARVGQYKNTTMIMASGWQGLSAFQEKTGHNPEPAKAFHIDFRTRKTTIIDFERPDSLKRGAG